MDFQIISQTVFVSELCEKWPCLKRGSEGPLDWILG